MKGRCLVLAAFVLGVPRGAGAEPTPDFHLLGTDNFGNSEPQDTAPGAFNGVGSFQRTWSIQDDFGTNRQGTVANRVEIAGAIAPSSHLPRFHFVFRVDTAAAAGGLAEGGAVFRWPLLSAGVRVTTDNERHTFEAGLRLVPPWPARSSDNTPNAVALALDATLASGLADDAQWLSFTSTGGEWYGDLSTRTGPCAGRYVTVMAGLRGGAVFSFAPMQVRTWLGPQSAMIGNVYVEGFLDVPRVVVDLDLQLGLRAVASFSNIWPGTEPLPVGGYLFLGWSPKYWFAARVFGGVAGSPTGGDLPFRYPVGARVELYVP